MQHTKTASWCLCSSKSTFPLTSSSYATFQQGKHQSQFLVYSVRAASQPLDTFSVNCLPYPSLIAVFRSVLGVRNVLQNLAPTHTIRLNLYNSQYIILLTKQLALCYDSCEAYLKQSGLNIGMDNDQNWTRFYENIALVVMDFDTVYKALLHNIFRTISLVNLVIIIDIILKYTPIIIYSKLCRLIDHRTLKSLLLP